MLELKDDSLQQILPSSIASDKTVQDIAKAISAKLQLINRQTELILLLPRLDELSETLIDELAWQYHVDFYDYQADIVKNVRWYAMLLPGIATRARRQQWKRFVQQYFNRPKCLNGGSMAVYRTISRCALLKRVYLIKGLLITWSAPYRLLKTLVAG